MSSPALPAALANRLRYRHLMLLHQLGELGNLHRAAEAISLAQPSASKMLRDIELAFGFPCSSAAPAAWASPS
jgi:molybdenum-dependent DNA-binding transcriptional regulator ModE